MRRIALVATVVVTLMLAVTPFPATAHPSAHGSPYPTASTTLRLIAKYPDGLTAVRGEQVLANGGRDVVTLLEADAPEGGCIHDQLADLDLKTGKLRLGPVVTCYAWLFRSDTGQVYMTRPYHRGTELLRLNSRLTPLRVVVVGLAPTGFRAGAPVPGTDDMWLALTGRVALFELTTGKVLRSLRLPRFVSGRPQGLALAGLGGPLYVTYWDPLSCQRFCAVLAEVNPNNGVFIVRRRLDYFTGWPVATHGGVFVGLYNQGTGVVTNVYSAVGLRLLSGADYFSGTVPVWLTATGEVVWWSAEPPGASNMYCGWITPGAALGYVALRFNQWTFVWGKPIGTEPGTGDMLLAGTAATAKLGESGLFAISTPRQCKEHM